MGTLASNAYFNVYAASEDTPRIGLSKVLTGAVPAGMTGGSANSGLARVSAESLSAGNPFDVRIHRGANEIGGRCVELRRGPDMGSKRS
jgi:hypothetical protein